jgi:hypothetical protein
MISRIKFDLIVYLAVLLLAKYHKVDRQVQYDVHVYPRE